MIEEPEEPEGGEDEDVSDAPTADRPMSNNTLMATKAEADAEVEKTRLKTEARKDEADAEVEKARIAADAQTKGKAADTKERTMAWGTIGKIALAVVALAALVIAGYWGTQGVTTQVEHEGTTMKVGGE